MTDWLRPLETALDASPAPHNLFFRDDDAGWGDDELLALLDLFGRRGLPLDLAAIPTEVTAELARDLAARFEAAPARLGIHQHGFAHANHQSEGRKCEFGNERSADRQMRDLKEGRSRLEALLGTALDPFFTPPWNRCTQTTVDCLQELGFRLLSRDVTAKPLDPGTLAELPVAVDWSRERKVGWARLGEVTAKALEQSEPAGIMLHHAVMDDDDLRHLDDLLRLLADHPKARVRAMRDLI